MNTSKFKVNLAAHGKNCSDLRCVLPVCVNWRLANSHKNLKPNNKRNWDTSEGDSGRSDGKLQRGEASSKVEPQTQSGSSENHDYETLKNLLDDLEDLDDLIQSGHQDEFRPFKGTATLKTDLLLNHSNQEDLHHLPPDAASWNQPANQLPSYPFSKKENRPTTQNRYENSSAFPFLSNDSVARYNESDFSLQLDPESFTPMAPYVANMTSNGASFDGQDCYNGKIQSPSTVVENIVFSLKESSRQLRGGTSCPKKPLDEPASKSNRLFGILSEILQMFEDPMSVDLEAFYVQVLQKALTDIKDVTCCLYPTKKH